MKLTQTLHDSPLGQVAWFTLTNASGASVTLSALGAAIQAVRVPDRAGALADVVIGYDEAAAYIADGPCAGKIPGRYANRLALGRITVDGVECVLPINNGPNSLHGGPQGFQNQLWEARACSHNPGRVVFTHHSPDGTAGYPGDLTVKATYTWDEHDTLTLDLEAQVQGRATVVNLTNHAYFNLAGHGAGSVLDHLLQIHGTAFLPTDKTQIPTGELALVWGTPMDFTEPKPIGRDIKADFEPLKIGKGYDHCWVVDGEAGRLRPAATLYDPSTGRRVDVLTDQPGVQIYTGNWLEGCPAGKEGATYHDYSAVAMECQGFPDAPNHANFPSQLLRPGQEYHRTIRWAFTAC